jgi:RNA polymerase sigma factor (sigma-70 family)
MKTVKTNGDIALINEIKGNNCNESLIELSKLYSAVCYDMCNKYSHVLSNLGAEMQDLIDQKDYFVYRAATSFDPDRNVKFSTWLGNFTKYQCLNAINKRKNVVLLDDDKLTHFIEKESEERGRSDPRELKDTGEYVFNILNKLKDERISRVFNLRYFSGEKKLTWQKVAKKLDISTQTAINLHEKGRKILKNKLKNKESSDLI